MRRFPRSVPIKHFRMSPGMVNRKQFRNRIFIVVPFPHSSEAIKKYGTPTAYTARTPVKLAANILK